MTNEKGMTVVLADDHAIVREGIAAICESKLKLRIIGQCADGVAALDVINSTNPDLAIIDLNMPKLHGLELIRKLRQAGNRSKILVLSVSHDQKTILEALRFGANAYLLKDGPTRHLMEAINHVLDGGVYLSPLIEATRLFAPPRKARSEDPVDTLSTREHEVFSLIVEGFRTKEIAARLGISSKTVDAYRASLMRKLDIHDIAGLVKYAIQRNPALPTR